MSNAFREGFQAYCDRHGIAANQLEKRAFAPDPKKKTKTLLESLGVELPDMKRHFAPDPKKKTKTLLESLGVELPDMKRH